MSHQPYSTGAVAIYVGTEFGQFPELLGWGEEAPEMKVITKYGTVLLDRSCNNIPFDHTWEGQVAIISVVLTSWDEAVAQALTIVPAADTGSSIENKPGTWTQEDFGVLMGAEDWSFPLWLRYLYGSGETLKFDYTASARAGSLNAGFRFPKCFVREPWSIESGARPMKRQFIFFALADPPVPQTNVGSASVIYTSQPKSQKYTLYDFDMSDVVNVPLI